MFTKMKTSVILLFSASISNSEDFNSIETTGKEVTIPAEPNDDTKHFSDDKPSAKFNLMKTKYFIIVFLSIWVFQLLLSFFNTDYLVSFFNSPSKLAYITFAFSILNKIKSLMLLMIAYKIFTYPNRSDFLNS
ncbi:hypothetical protein [Kordia jejudonensis]|uniref:hypothetical protein n=1 Tax=Kordia jejudonensis TaxID=1348245 RepID=UPI0006298347|nr:hypothetical protein [Kordia jejudonensis]